jgi:SAM-dependent methyltransferase
MYVCPDCKTPLENLFCGACQHQFAQANGIPVLLSKDSRFQSGSEIGHVYDDIYGTRSKVWEDQGRTPEFIAYFSNLLAAISTGRVLEIGCGEGFLLSSLRAKELVAVELSAEALRKARARISADYSQALAERLPFPSNSFDLVLTVGVMEHFLDDREAAREIQRVLRPGGYYAALIHVDLNFLQRMAQKFSEYVFPHFRPIALFRYLSSKVVKPIRQPIQIRYTVSSAKACFEACGFHVRRVISKSIDADVPLIGPHVVIYLSQK